MTRSLFRDPDSVATGRFEAANSAVGVLHPELREVLTDFHQLNTEGARAAFADRWVRRAGSRLEQVWPMLYELLRIIKAGELYTKPGYLENKQTFPDFAAYFEATMGQPFATWGELEKTHHFVQEYAPELWEAGYSTARAEALKRLDQEDEAAQRGPGRPPKNGNIITNKTHRPEGTSAAKALRRLRAGRPDLHARVLAGEVSPHAAMLEAGFRRRMLSVEPEPAALDRFIRRHLAPAQRAELVRLLSQEAAG